MLLHWVSTTSFAPSKVPQTFFMSSVQIFAAHGHWKGRFLAVTFYDFNLLIYINGIFN